MEPKIKQLQEKYDIDLDNELISRREAEQTYRELRDYINERVVAAALQDESLSVSISDVLEILRNNPTDLTEHQTDVLFTLEQHDLDLEEIENDLVSHVTVRKYLRNELGIRNEPEPMTEEKAFKTIDWALSRDQDILKNVLEQLADEEKLDLGGGISVSVNATVQCNDSGQRWLIDRFIEQGGCESEQ